MCIYVLRSMYVRCTDGDGAYHTATGLAGIGGVWYNFLCHGYIVHTYLLFVFFLRYSLSNIVVYGGALVCASNSIRCSSSRFIESHQTKIVVSYTAEKWSTSYNTYVAYVQEVCISMWSTRFDAEVGTTRTPFLAKCLVKNKNLANKSRCSGFGSSNK